MSEPTDKLLEQNDKDWTEVLERKLSLPRFMKSVALTIHRRNHNISLNLLDKYCFSTDEFWILCFA